MNIKDRIVSITYEFKPVPVFIQNKPFLIKIRAVHTNFKRDISLTLRY